jgi:lipoprotein-anchoring transpeptidase ErfK/SrfK
LFVSKVLASVFVLVGIAAVLPSAARAQDCNRYAWACSGWSAPQRGLFSSGTPETAPPAPQLREPPLQLREPPPQGGLDRGSEARYAALYGPALGEPFPVPAINLSEVNPAFLRTTVMYPTREPAGTIVIDPAHHYLYLVLGNGRAIRYGVGVGRAGFGWSGSAYVHDKQKWPDWYPPKEMIERQPAIKKQLSELQSGLGMHGGPGNPLGGRALYLWQGNKDTLYRIHGTVEPWTIGKSVSSGCIRMLNQDVMDLYDRTPVGTKVVVLGRHTG